MTQPKNNQQKNNSGIKGISIDILWFLIVLSGILFLISLIPLPPNDFWWHLKIGEDIYSNHIIPATNIYAWTLPTDQPFYYAAWLSEFLFFALYKIGKTELIIFIRTLLIAFTFCIIASEAHRRSKSWRITALVIALLGLMSFNNMLVRTQIWAWIPFVLTYIVVLRYTEGKIRWYWLLACPLSMVFWVNVHGSYILGLIIPGAFFLGGVIAKLVKIEETQNWQQIGMIGGTSVLSGLATLINPRFFGIINYTINLLTNPPSQQLIEEWQSPTPQGLANISFYISILIFILVLAYSKYKLSPSEIILFTGFLWLAWSGQRYVIWYGIVITPILAKLMSALPIKMSVFVPQKNWINLIIAIIIFLPVIFAQPWFVEKLPLPNTFWEQILPNTTAGPLLSTDTPVAATEYLKTHPGGHLFNEMGYGSYLIWAIPKQGVFIDPRVELFPYDQWMDYVHINNGIEYDETLARYGADRILLDKKLQPELAMLLPMDKHWILEYDNQYSQIWTKISAP
jgi:hypothetical protein